MDDKYSVRHQPDSTRASRPWVIDAPDHAHRVHHEHAVAACHNKSVADELVLLLNRGLPI